MAITAIMCAGPSRHLRANDGGLVSGCWGASLPCATPQAAGLGGQKRSVEEGQPAGQDSNEKPAPLAFGDRDDARRCGEQDVAVETNSAKLGLMVSPLEASRNVVM